MCTRFNGNFWKPNFCRNCQRNINKHNAELIELTFACSSKDDDSDQAENLNSDVVDATLEFTEIRNRPTSVRVLGPVVEGPKPIINDVHLLLRDDTISVESESNAVPSPKSLNESVGKNGDPLIDLNIPKDMTAFYGSSPLLNNLLEKIEFESEMEFNLCRIMEKLRLLNSSIIKFQTLCFDTDISFSSNYKIVAGTENYIIWFSKKDRVFQILSDREFVLLDSYEDVIRSMEIKTKKNKNSYNYGVKVKATSIRTFEQWSLKEKSEKSEITSVFYFLIQTSLSLQKLSAYCTDSLNMNDLLVMSSNDNYEKMLIFAFVGESNGDFTGALNMVKNYTHENSQNIINQSQKTNSILEIFQQVVSILETFINDKVTNSSITSHEEFTGLMNAYNLVLLFAFHVYKLNSENNTMVDDKSKIQIDKLMRQIFCNAMLFHTDVINLLLSGQHVDTKQILLNSQLVLMLLKTYSFYHP